MNRLRTILSTFGDEARAGGVYAPVEAREAAEKSVKTLMLELIGEDDIYGTERDYRVARNEVREELRKKVNAL